jgi:hypothetical protein
VFSTTRTRPVPTTHVPQHVNSETRALHQLVRHLVADGDARAAKAGRRARRTRSEMAVAR